MSLNKSKKCFECKKIKTLDSFPVNTRKYQLKSDLGRGIVCYSCIKVRALREMTVVKLNRETNKFDIIVFKNKNQVEKYIRDLKKEV